MKRWLVLRCRNRAMLQEDMKALRAKGWRDEGTMTYALLSREGEGETHLTDDREEACHKECQLHLWDNL